MTLILSLSGATYNFEIRFIAMIIINKCVSDQKPFYPLKGRPEERRSDYLPPKPRFVISKGQRGFFLVVGPLKV